MRFPSTAPAAERLLLHLQAIEKLSFSTNKLEEEEEGEIEIRSSRGNKDMRDKSFAVLLSKYIIKYITPVYSVIILYTAAATAINILWATISLGRAEGVW